MRPGQTHPVRPSLQGSLDSFFPRPNYSGPVRESVAPPERREDWRTSDRVGALVRRPDILEAGTVWGMEAALCPLLWHSGARKVCVISKAMGASWGRRAVHSSEAAKANPVVGGDEGADGHQKGTLRGREGGSLGRAAISPRLVRRSGHRPSRAVRLRAILLAPPHAKPRPRARRAYPPPPQFRAGALSPTSRRP